MVILIVSYDRDINSLNTPLFTAKEFISVKIIRGLY